MKLLLIFLSCSCLSINIFGQTIDTVKINADFLRTPQNILKREKPYILLVDETFIAIKIQTLEKYKNDAGTMQKIIKLYDKKDSIRKNNIAALNDYYDALLSEYKKTTDNVTAFINTTNGQLSKVQENMLQTAIHIGAAETNINEAQIDIRGARTDIVSAQKNIESAINSINMAKQAKILGIPKATFSLIAGGIIGFIIGKKIN